MDRPELTHKHYEWWICLVIVVFLVVAITVFGHDILHGTTDDSYLFSVLLRILLQSSTLRAWMRLRILTALAVEL